MKAPSLTSRQATVFKQFKTRSPAGLSLNCLKWVHNFNTLLVGADGCVVERIVLHEKLFPTLLVEAEILSGHLF